MHPASMRDIQSLPVGLRETESIAIVSEVELLPLREQGNPTGRGDVVAWQGKSYRVRSAWKQGAETMPDIGPLVHWRAVAVLEQD